MISKVDAVSRSGISGANLARAESLLSVTSMLLARGRQARAVRVLHAEIARVLSLEGFSATQRGAEEQQRELLDVLSSARAAALWSAPRGPALRRALSLGGLPRLASWVIFVAVVGGLSMRYGYGLLQLGRWQREHPDGPWISRYYPTRRFKGTPVVRYDVAIDYDWGSGAPAQTLQRDYWAARWDTCVVVPADVVVPLTLVADDEAKLILDDVVLLQERRLERRTAKVLLRAGVRHLRVDYQDGMARAKVQLQGLESAGTGAYHLQRPVFVQGDVRCEPGSTSTPAGLATSTGGAQ